VNVQEFGPEHTPDHAFVEGLCSSDRHVVNKMALHPRGVIQYARKCEQVDWVVNACRAFPDTRCIVAVTSKKQARRWWRLLQSRLAERVGLICNKVSRQGTRVTVMTMRSIGCDRGDKAGLLLLPDAAEAANSIAIEQLLYLGYAPTRIYGFLAGDRRLDRQQAILTEVVVGRVIHSSGLLPPTVRVLTTDGCSTPLPRVLIGLAFKRAAFWQNDDRNRRVAAAARAAAAADMPALWKLGMLVECEETFFAGRRPRVAVLAESPEHCSRLQEMLPGWKKYGVHNTGHGDGILLTVTAAMTARLDVDIVVVASGGEALPELPLLKPSNRPADRMEMLLIDFNDGVDGALSQQFADRLHRYRRQRWTVEPAHQRFSPSDEADGFLSSNGFIPRIMDDKSTFATTVPASSSSTNRPSADTRLNGHSGQEDRSHQIHPNDLESPDALLAPYKGSPTAHGKGIGRPDVPATAPQAAGPARDRPRARSRKGAPMPNI
jgi:hypothetical protein